MKRTLTFLFVISLALYAFAEVNDTFSQNGIRYQVTKEDPAAQAFEVSAVYLDSAYIFLPDSVANDEYAYAVTNTIQWYNPQNCSLRHYAKIDMSEAKHITTLNSQRSGLIAIDTLILPPNLSRFPSWFHTTDSLNALVQLMDTENLLPGIHRIWSTGTQAMESLRLQECTSLLEADLSSYTTTFANSGQHQFSSNPFLERLVIPNTITKFIGDTFYGDIRLTDLNIPDSLIEIDNPFAQDLAMDTLRLGSKVSYLACGFATGWYHLQHIEVDSTNASFMGDNGVLYTEDQLKLISYPFTRSGYSYQMPPNTESLCDWAFANGWDNGEVSDVSTFNWETKKSSDAAPLKELVCCTKLTDLGNTGTFYGSSIRKIHGFSENHVREIPSICFKISAIDSIALPFGLTDIGGGAFSFTYNLRTISNLSRLRNLRFIGPEAFRDAWKLDSIDLLPCDKLLAIPKSMCYNDSALEFVSLPRNVQSIGEEAFKDCGSLRQVVCPAVVPIPIDASVFEGVNKQECVLKVPAQSISLYRNAPVWEEFFHIDTTGFYYLKTAVSDSLAGSVSGGGAYMRGDIATLSADASKGYRLVSWSDGNPYSLRMVTVTKDESFKAIFEPIPLHTLTVVANDDTMGQVTGSGVYEEGAAITLTATPREGYCLQSWSFTNEPSDTVQYIIPVSDATVTAYFAPCAEEALEPVYETSSAIKILRDGQVFIFRDDKTYTVIGQEVNRRR